MSFPAWHPCGARRCQLFGGPVCMRWHGPTWSPVHLPPQVKAGVPVTHNTLPMAWYCACTSGSTGSRCSGPIKSLHSCSGIAGIGRGRWQGVPWGAARSRQARGRAPRSQGHNSKPQRQACSTSLAQSEGDTGTAASRLMVKQATTVSLRKSKRTGMGASSTEPPDQGAKPLSIGLQVTQSCRSCFKRPAAANVQVPSIAGVATVAAVNRAPSVSTALAAAAEAPRAGS